MEQQARREWIAEALVKLKNEDKNKDHLPWDYTLILPRKDHLINQFGWKDNAFALFFLTIYTGKEEPVKRERNKPKTKSADEAFKGAVGGKKVSPQVPPDSH